MPNDLAKTLSFLALHLLVGFSVAYALTGSLAIAGGIALIEPCVNAVVFFFHERAWRGEISLARLFVHDHGPLRARLERFAAGPGITAPLSTRPAAAAPR